MNKFLIFMAGLWLVASGSLAAVLQDFSEVKPKKNMGTYSDEKGTKVSLSQVAGPGGTKALFFSGNVVEWAGAWVSAPGDLTKAGSVRFQAKAASPCVLRVGLMDDRKVQVMSDVRVVSEEWTEFSLPLSSFQPTRYPDPEARKEPRSTSPRSG
jgi:hypothetical protein